MRLTPRTPARVRNGHHLMKQLRPSADVAKRSAVLLRDRERLIPRTVHRAVPGDILRQVLRAELARALASGHRIAVAGTPRRARVGSVVDKAGITYAHAPATALSASCSAPALRRLARGQRATACLPGTHALGVLSEVDTERLVREIPPVDCLVPSGGIIAMRPLILHASSKAETDHPRRVLHIEYVDSLEVDDGLRIAIA